MTWITTDTDVACTLVVYKTVSGQNIPGYPKQYSILDAFGDFPAISVESWHKSEPPARMSRISAFIAHINQTESIDVESTQTNDVFRPSAETPGVIVEP